MLNDFHLYLGYEVSNSILHPGINPHIGALFIGPYLTCLIKCMGILEGIDRMRVVDGISFMTLEILRLMGMLQHVLTARRVSTVFVSPPIFPPLLLPTYSLQMLLSPHPHQRLSPHDRDHRRHPMLTLAT